ncbi:hypothetical protein HDU96_003045 [Phlyctochytrium bullatum]|nr:hypothetical protein HDU96_003045 [Phlyctochytrium bullatum]
MASYFLVLQQQKRKYQSFIERLNLDNKRKQKEIDALRGELELIRDVLALAGLDVDLVELKALVMSKGGSRVANPSEFVASRAKKLNILPPIGSQPAIHGVKNDVEDIGDTISALSKASGHDVKSGVSSVVSDPSSESLAKQLWDPCRDPDLGMANVASAVKKGLEGGHVANDLMEGVTEESTTSKVGNVAQSVKEYSAPKEPLNHPGSTSTKIRLNRYRTRRPEAMVTSGIEGSNDAQILTDSSSDGGRGKVFNVLLNSETGSDKAMSESVEAPDLVGESAAEDLANSKLGTLLPPLRGVTAPESGPPDNPTFSGKGAGSLLKRTVASLRGKNGTLLATPSLNTAVVHPSTSWSKRIMGTRVLRTKQWKEREDGKM